MKIKICCISSIEEAALAVNHGAWALGLVSAMPSGPGPIPESLIAEIVASVPPPVHTFLLTSRQDAASIIAQQRYTKADTLQLVDAVSDETYRELRKELPGVPLVQVIHVRGEESVDEARRMAERADMLLLDSGNPNLAVKELGGTGRTHDWSVSRRIVESVRVPVFLAGGLHAGNVREAVAAVQPFGVDLCSGVRTEGRMDAEKVRRFFGEVKSSNT